MVNYNIYIGAGKVVGVLVLFLLLMDLFFPNNWSVLIGLISLPVGLYELIAGISLFLSKRKRPAWFDRHIRYYWTATAVYFMVTYIFYQIELSNGWWVFWLLVVPWGIAIYQYVIVYLLRDALIAQKETERWEKGQDWEKLESSESI